MNIEMCNFCNKHLVFRYFTQTFLILMKQYYY